MPLALLPRFVHPTAQHELTILSYSYMNSSSNPQSDTYLFADDIKIFRPIINTNDQDILQHDITTMQKWSHDWMLTLHPDKCTHMEIGKNNVGENQYYTTMNNVTKTIDTHDKQKHLGVTFDSKLTFYEHISRKPSGK